MTGRKPNPQAVPHTVATVSGWRQRPRTATPQGWADREAPSSPTARMPTEGDTAGNQGLRVDRGPSKADVHGFPQIKGGAMT